MKVVKILLIILVYLTS